MEKKVAKERRKEERIKRRNVEYMLSKIYLEYRTAAEDLHPDA